MVIRASGFVSEKILVFLWCQVYVFVIETSVSNIRSEKKDIQMKTVVLSINDDSKFHLLVSFLREIRFVRIEDEPAPVGKIRKMSRLPPSVLHPVKAENFRMFGREELHDRQSFH